MRSGKDLLALSIIALIACAFFLPVLDGASILSERDLAVFFIPPRLLWTEMLLGGEFPLWNPYSYIGHPLFATLQPGVLYPPNVLLLLLPFELGFNWVIITHFILAGSFTYALLRYLGADRPSSLAGAFVFMLSGYLFSVHNVLSTLLSSTWLPLAALLTLRMFRDGSWSFALLNGATLALIFLGGGIESLLSAFMLVGFLAVSPSCLDTRSCQSVPFSRRIILFAVSIAVFLALSSVQLLPFIELAGLSIRAGGLPYAEAATWSFDFKDFIQFIIPDPYGYASSSEKYWGNQSWLKTVYTGFTPLILSALFLWRHGRRALPMALAGLFFFSLAMGKNNLFYEFLYAWVPLFNKFRYPVKFILVPFLMLAVTAGLGLKAFKDILNERPGALKHLSFVLLSLATLAALAFGALDYFAPEAKAWMEGRALVPPDFSLPEVNIFNTKRLLFFLIMLAVIMYGATRLVRLRRYAPVAIALLLGVDLFFAHNNFYGYTKKAEYMAKSATMEAVSGDEGLYRVFVTPKTMREDVKVPKEDFDADLIKSLRIDRERITGFNLLHRISEVSGIEVMMRGEYNALYDRMASRPRADSTNLLALFNVKYVVSIPVIDSPEFRLKSVIGAKQGADLKRAGDTGSLKVYENLNFLPRFFFVDDYKVVKDKERTASMLLDKAFVPAETVLLEEEPWAAGRPAMDKTGASVEVIDYKNNSVELKVESPARAILVASEAWYPGWKAFVDGAESKVLKADGVVRAVAIEPGVHDVRFVYSPLSFRAGAWVSIFSVPVFCIAFYFSIKRKDHERA